MKHGFLITEQRTVEVDLPSKKLVELLRFELTTRLNNHLYSLKLPELAHDLPADGFHFVRKGGSIIKVLEGYGGRKPRDWSFIVKDEWIKSVDWINLFQACETLEQGLK